MKQIEEPDKIRWKFDGELTNVAHNPKRKVPKVPLASALGKELHSPILGTLKIHGGQVNRERS